MVALYKLTSLSPRLITGQCIYAVVPTWTVRLPNPLMFPNLKSSGSESRNWLEEEDGEWSDVGLGFWTIAKKVKYRH